MRSFPVRLPSLDLVRGFVAVGRRMSITLAAQDLFLTQSAVSRQIIALEEALGVKLINRGYRSIGFTAEGERFFRVADSALQQLQDGVNALAAGRDRQPVTITASIGVTGLWIMPRLGGFQQRHPDIDVRVAANNRVVDLRTGGADVAIRYCPASIRLAGDVHEAGHPLRQVIVAGAFGVGARLPEAGDRAIDEAWIDRAQTLVVEAEFLQCRRP